MFESHSSHTEIGAPNPVVVPVAAKVEVDRANGADTEITVPYVDKEALEIVAIEAARQDARQQLAWAVEAVDGVAMPEIDPVVTAPTSRELAVMGGLAVADERTRVAYWQGELPALRQRLLERGAPELTPGFEECRLEHAALETQAAQALQSLVGALSSPEVEEQNTAWEEIRVITSRQAGRFARADGTLQSVRREVRITVNEDGLRDTLVPAIRVYTWRSQPSSGHLLGGVAAQDNPDITEQHVIREDDLAVPSLRQIAKDVSRLIRIDTWEEGVRPWLEQYAALSAPTADRLSPNEQTAGMIKLPEGAAGLLLRCHDTERSALSALCSAFGGGIARTLQSLEAIPPDDLAHILQQYGATSRFDWLMQHAEEIHASVVDAEQRALDERFRDDFITWRSAKEHTIDQVAALADETARLSGKSIDLIAPAGAALLRRDEPIAPSSSEASVDDTVFGQLPPIVRPRPL